MSARLLTNLWRLQRVNVIGQRICTKSYATRTDATTAPACLITTTTNIGKHNSHLLQSNAIENKRRYSTATAAKAAPRDRTPNAEVLLQRLETQYQHNNFINYEQLCKVVELLAAQTAEYNQLLTADRAHFLLSACGTLMPAKRAAERLELFERLWQYLAQHAQISVAHYRLKLEVLQYNRAPIADFRQFLQDVAQIDAAAANEPVLFAELLDVACSSGDMRQATDVLAEMRAHNIALSERNFVALILGHGRSGDLNGCQTVLDNMSAAGLPLSTETQTHLIIAHMENAALDKAAEIFSKFQRQFNISQILKILRATVWSADITADFVAQLVRELPAEYAGPELPIALQHICIELLHSGKLETVRTIIETLPTPVFNENQNVDTFCSFLLHELFRAQIATPQIIEFTQLLRESGKNTRALHIATEIALRRSPPTALPFLETLKKLEKLRPHYFWPLIMYNLRRHGDSGILATLKHMSNLSVECDRETFQQYVLPHIMQLLEDPKQALKMLDDAGLKPSQVLMPILGHLLAQQKLDEAAAVLALYPTKFDGSQLLVPLTSLAVNVRATKRYQIYAKVLAAIAQKSTDATRDFVGELLLHLLATQTRICGDVYAMQRFLDEMHKFGLTMSPAAISAIESMLLQQKQQLKEAQVKRIQETLQNMSNAALVLPNGVAGGESSGSATGGSLSFIKHPRDMTLDELEYHLIELEAKQLNTRGVLRRLLQVCVRDGRLERAVEIKAKCDALHVQVSPGMLASILDLHIKLKDLPNAQKSLKRLQQTCPGFQVDEHKIIDYAALLVHEAQLDAAKELLRERAMTQKVHGGDYVIKNVWNFLTNVAQLAAQQPATVGATQTRENFKFLQQLGYCRSHNALLGPIVREHLLRGDIAAAVAEFQLLADQYKHTPLQFELLSLLVRLGNANATEIARFPISVDEAQRLLGEVTATVTKVHSAVNMNSALLLAFAESGTDGQLRRLLINPEFRINNDQLLKNCEHLGQEGAVTTLLRLARGARGLNQVVDEQSIYNMLLKNFVHANDFAAALDLYERLESDDDLKISQEFLRNLVHLLRLNNMEIPSNIALRAQIM